MKISTFGAIVAQRAGRFRRHDRVGWRPARADAKACYRPHCGKSIKGHEGKCGGMRSTRSPRTACETAGGAWTTAAEAKKFEKKHDK
jgi:hypothetical protein